MIKTKTMNLTVVKRDGVREPLNYEKINKVLLWATETSKGEPINGVSASDIAMNAKLSLKDGITTNEIHQVLIQSAVDLITDTEPNYQYVASNLLNFFLRKNIFDTFENMPPIKDVVETNVVKGVYDSVLLDNYTSEDFEKINTFIKHHRDLNFTYAGLQQLSDKYLLKDRITKEIFETPQYMYMLIAMTLFADYEKKSRLGMIKTFYNITSKWQISLPTPIMCGVRTPNRQYSSCTLIDVGDSLESLESSNSAIMKYTARRAGIGINMGRVRALGSSIRGGEVVHTGVVPFLKMYESTVKSCTQNGVRGGSATTYFPFWHLEIEDILVLKNNKGTDNNRVRKLDYGVQFCRLFYRRFVKNETITLFSPHEVPELYEAFGDNDLFEELYEKCERKTSIAKKKIKARDLFNQFCQERIGTGRMYIQNIDHVNEHSAFLDKVFMSNLCVEINLPTSPINHIDDGKMVKRYVKIPKNRVTEYEEFRQENKFLFLNGESGDVHNLTANETPKGLFELFVSPDQIDSESIVVEDDFELVYGETPGEIALCVLSAINLGAIRDLAQLEEICEFAVRALDFVIENQDYPVHSAEKMYRRRSIGVGITNLAYYFAKNGVEYGSSESLELLDKTMEHIQYYLIKGSVQLAKEYGKCDYFDRTKYSKGLLPIDTYNKNVDDLVKRDYDLDWEGLRADVLEHGMRNSTLTAIMPCESSSVVSNSTNGMETPRSLITIKKSKQGLLKMVVPEIHRLKNKYKLSFDVTNDEYTNIQSVIQKWIDQGISGNHYYNMADGVELSIASVAKDLLNFYKYGGKQLYYANTADGKTDDFSEKINGVVVEEENEDCAGGACSI
jgi:ribonucleoside-diphosphate reductase alpha chain